MTANTKGRVLQSGEVARLAGVSTDTLRHYERVGVLARPLRSGGGYRQYPVEAVDRVRLVRRSLAVGFTLAELARVLNVRDKGGAPCRQVRALAESKLALVERQLRDLTDTRDYIRTLLTDWDRRLAQTPEGARAGLLETLVLFDEPQAGLPKQLKNGRKRA